MPRWCNIISDRASSVRAVCRSSAIACLRFFHFRTNWNLSTTDTSPSFVFYPYRRLTIRDGHRSKCIDPTQLCSKWPNTTPPTTSLPQNPTLPCASPRSYLHCTTTCTGSTFQSVSTIYKLNVTVHRLLARESSKIPGRLLHTVAEIWGNRGIIPLKYLGRGDGDAFIPNVYKMSLQIVTVKEIEKERITEDTTPVTDTQSYFIGLLIYMQAHTMIVSRLTYRYCCFWRNVWIHVSLWGLSVNQINRSVYRHSGGTEFKSKTNRKCLD